MTAKHEFLFILYARQLWKKLHQSEEALTVLRQGLVEHCDSEDIVIALQKLLRDVSQFTEAQEVLDRALSEYPTERIQMQAIQIKRELGDINAALEICNRAIETEYKSFYKFWLIKA